MVGDSEVLESGLNNQFEHKRETSLKHKIIDLIPEEKITPEKDFALKK